MVGTRRHPEVQEPAATSDEPSLKSPENAKGKARPDGRKTATQQQLAAAGDTGGPDSPAARNPEQHDVTDPEVTAVPDAVNPSNTEHHHHQQQELPQPRSGPNKQKRKHTATVAAPSPPIAAPSQQSTGYDLLPTELLQELKQLRPQQLVQGKSTQTHQQQQQQVTRKAKKKQRLVEVQKGPVRVAVLPAVAGAAGGGQQQQQSTGASLRQQLLESRLHRSRAML